MSLRFPSKRRNKPSAIGLRQMFPVQTKRTLFTICAARERAHLQPRIERSQVNRRWLQFRRVAKWRGLSDACIESQCAGDGRKFATNWNGLGFRSQQNWSLCSRAKPVFVSLKFSDF